MKLQKQSPASNEIKGLIGSERVLFEKEKFMKQNGITKKSEITLTNLGGQTLNQDNDKNTQIINEMDEIDSIWSSVQRNTEQVMKTVTKQKGNLFAHLVKEVMFKNIKILDRKDKLGRTPLHIAAFYGHKALVESMITLGADFNVEHSMNLRPLDVTPNEMNQNTVSSSTAEKFISKLKSKKKKQTQNSKQYSIEVRDLEKMQIETLNTSKLGVQQLAYLM